MSDRSRTDISGSYSPFEPTRDARALGLTSHRHRDPHFGDVHVMVRRSPTANTAEATVLLHGIGGTWSSWSYVIRAAEQSGTDLGNLLIFDLPGFGESQNRARSLDAELVAKLVVDVAAAEGFTRGRVVGQSMGGYLALTMAAIKPDFCTGVVAMSGTLLGLSALMRGPRGRLVPRPHSTTGRLTFRVLQVIGSGLRPLARVGGRTGVLRGVLARPAAHPELLSRQMLVSLANGIRPAAFLLAADNARLRDALQDWHNITCPVVLAFGAEDSFAGVREAEAVREVLPHLQLELLPECGHLIPLENPASVVRLITMGQ